VGLVACASDEAAIVRLLAAEATGRAVYPPDTARLLSPGGLSAMWQQVRATTYEPGTLYLVAPDHAGAVQGCESLLITIAISAC
jgi:hypothetical protein